MDMITDVMWEISDGEGLFFYLPRAYAGEHGQEHERETEQRSSAAVGGHGSVMSGRGDGRRGSSSSGGDRTARVRSDEGVELS